MKSKKASRKSKRVYRTKKSSPFGFKHFIILILLVFAAVLFFRHQLRISAQVAKPNIVIVMTDDQNIDSLAVMRKLMSFPEGSWVNFTNAFTNHALCCPARSTVLTGQYAFKHGVTVNAGSKFKDASTLATWLDNAGYRTGLFGKYLNGYPWNKGASYIPPGWDSFKGNGGHIDGLVGDAVNFINTSTTPFFLYLSPVDPHIAANPPARYDNAVVSIPPKTPNYSEADVSDKPQWVRNLKTLSSNYKLAERTNSQRALLAVDDAVQTIVDTLKAKGKLNNTMIIFMGDHGFSWGSHRWFRKDCPYEECIKFPLVIRYPGLSGNRQESRIVSNVDLASTIAEYAGVTPGLPQSGRSILPIITNTATTWTEAVLFEKYPTSLINERYNGIRVPGWVYVEYQNAAREKELYDMTNDPYQLVNLANKPAYAAKQSELAQKLQIMLSGGYPGPTNGPTITPTSIHSPTPIPSSTPTPTLEPTTEPTATPSATTEPTP